ncbi:MAG: rhomboid family intramembrane serine protease [Candidatus Aenigmatarchaeota archaeon]|nr:MAG: rhomboid family intramembrane serine protease [Candidatus Aenigmarchaeota archaeon]
MASRSVHGYAMVTILLVASNFLIFFLQALIQPLTSIIALTPTLAFSGYYWQFFTYMFAHGGIGHVGFNMLALFLFGGVMERLLGWRKFLFLYIASGLASAGLHIALMGISNVPLLGASGAVFAVLAAYAYKYPKNILFVFPGIPVPAALLVAFFVVFEFTSGIFGFQPGIANFGHLGGIISGLAIMFYWSRTKRKSPIGEVVEYVWENW